MIPGVCAAVVVSNFEYGSILHIFALLCSSAIAEPRNMATTGGAIITVAGLILGLIDSSPSSMFYNGTMAASTSWISASALSFIAPAGSGSLSSARFPPNVADFDTAKMTFSFDGARRMQLEAQVTFSFPWRMALRSCSACALQIAAPVVTVGRITRNAPICSGISLTMLGANFAAHDRTPTVSFASACSTTSWTTQTRLMCAPQVGGPQVGGSTYSSVTVSMSVGCMVGAFTFDGAHQLANIAPIYLPVARRHNRASISAHSHTVHVYGWSF